MSGVQHARRANYIMAAIAVLGFFNLTTISFLGSAARSHHYKYAILQALTSYYIRVLS